MARQNIFAYVRVSTAGLSEGLRARWPASASSTGSPAISCSTDEHSVHPGDRGRSSRQQHLPPRAASQNLSFTTSSCPVLRVTRVKGSPSSCTGCFKSQMTLGPTTRTATAEHSHRQPEGQPPAAPETSGVRCHNQRPDSLFRSHAQSRGPRPGADRTADVIGHQLDHQLDIGAHPLVVHDADVPQADQGLEDLTRLANNEGASCFLGHTSSLKHLRPRLSAPLTRESAFPSSYLQIDDFTVRQTSCCCNDRLRTQVFGGRSRHRSTMPSGSALSCRKWVAECACMTFRLRGWPSQS